MINGFPVNQVTVQFQRQVLCFLRHLHVFPGHDLFPGLQIRFRGEAGGQAGEGGNEFLLQFLQAAVRVCFLLCLSLQEILRVGQGDKGTPVGMIPSLGIHMILSAPVCQRIDYIINPVHFIIIA